MGRRVALAVLALAAPAAAEPWRGQVEAGGEVDTNVQRVETGGDLENIAYTAPLVRAAGHVERAAPAGGGISLNLTGTLRTSIDRAVVSEDAATLGADVRYVRALGARPLALGARALYIDAIPLSGVTGTRTFRTLGADALLVLRREAGDLATLSAGGRSLTYKPDDDFDWRGPTVGLRYDRVVWRTDDDTRTVELSAEARVERRAYRGRAFVDRCPPDAEPMPSCFAPADVDRTDLVHAGLVEATYTGELVISGAYQIVIVDSNSYGQSLIRHRVTLSGTAEVYGWIATATLTGQLDQYLDTLVLARDVTSQDFTALDEDNRSSLQLRVLHALAGRTSFEARMAYWTDLRPDDVQFRRALFYGGITWATD